jgi:isomerase DpgB
MVTRGWPGNGSGTGEDSAGQAPAGELVVGVDGRRPPSADLVAALNAACDTVEDGGGQAALIVQVSGTPAGRWAAGLPVATVSKWERALRRLERLRVATIAVADGDCGGPALDALLATDYRIATASVRLLVPVVDGATWPGMALYRLARQAGEAAVRRAVMFGTPIESGAALALHLIDELAADPASALAGATALVGAFPGSELAIRRQLMLDAPTVSFEDALGGHLAACDRALRYLAAGVAP